MTQKATILQFQATLYDLQGQTLLRLPVATSKQLPSRGQVAVIGLMNGHDFQAVLEPDGDWGHWLRVNEMMQKFANVQAGDIVTMEMSQAKDWPEPDLPADLSAALKSAPTDVRSLWRAITPMARWEWVRWVQATNVEQTRQGRIEASVSKLKSGKRRPCCFNLAACTDSQLSKKR